MLSVCFGVIGVFIKPYLRHKYQKPPFWDNSSAIISDFLNAVSLAPFSLMFLSVFNHWIFQQLEASTGGFFGIAGFMGIVYVLTAAIDIKR